MAFSIRPLNAEDWREWKKIRLEALASNPEAFGSSYEEETAYDEARFRAILTDNRVFGAFIEDGLVGVAGFYIFKSNKTRHRGVLFGMFIKKEYRGQGIADALIQAVMEYAATKTAQLHCTVVTENAAALRLYQKHGFEIYGTEPRALKIGDRYHDEYLMVRKFD